MGFRDRRENVTEEMINDEIKYHQGTGDIYIVPMNWGLEWGSEVLKSFLDKE